MIEEESTLLRELDQLSTEVRLTYETLVLPNWNKKLHGLTQTLYAYVMMVFAHVGRASAFWAGTDESRGQTRRMVRFLSQYVYSDREANSVAVQMWRHKLMHTARPRLLRDRSSGKAYYWLLHWWQHLPKDQHFTILDRPDKRILNLGLVYLIDDLRAGIATYISDTGTSAALASNFKKVQSRFEAYRFTAL